MIGARLLGLLLALSACPPATATDWIEHASKPGAEIPPRGLSRFDQLYRQPDLGYRIPYPYAALVEDLEARVDNGRHGGVRQVLVPMGRSLQRHAPRPDYFRFPRAVLALEGEPVTRTDHAGLVLEYRLFIAHQPATETLEVISYNDALGRFEFQVVENYTTNGEARVRPARRAMCMSCHQNGGPIFPGTPWSETSFNVAVANRLAAEIPERNGSLIGIISNDAGIIDVLAERANYLSAAQLVWRDACGSHTCRKAMLRALLQYRLSGKASFNVRDALYRHDYVDEITRIWLERWPNGIALASSRIPDRDPFTHDEPLAHRDSLAPRAAHASWTRVDSVLANGIIFRLAGFFTAADIQRIDQHLIAVAPRRDLPRKTYRAACRSRPGTNASRILRCRAAAGKSRLHAEIELGLEQQHLRAIRILSLQVPGDGNIWTPRNAGMQLTGQTARIELAAAGANLSQRLADGSRISQLVLVRQDELAPQDFRLEIEVIDDFDILDEALALMLEDNRRGVGDSLAMDAFRREPILRELMRALAMPELRWPDATVPPPDRVEPGPAALNSDLVLLQPYCGNCHDRAGPFPPGFLSAPDARNQIIRCAPRMLARLRAWRDYPQASPMPMPPPASLGLDSGSTEGWAESEPYRALLSGLQRLVLEHHGEIASQQIAYTSLPQCSSEITR